MDGLAFDCPCCGKRYPGLPAITFGGPVLGYGEDGQPWRLDRNGGDLCRADGQYYFVRAVLRVPIIGETQQMEWGVWGSLSEASFRRYQESFDDHDQAKLGSLFSYLGNKIAGYPDTLGLRSSLVPQNDRKRPFVELDPSQDHPLVRDQMNGITRERAIEFVLPILHQEGNA
jgi:hypothetical protein